MQSAIIRNAADFISPDIACTWFENFPYGDRYKVRQVLIRIAVQNDRYELIEKYAHSREDHELVAILFVKNGQNDKAIEYINRHIWRTETGKGTAVYPYIIESEVRKDPTALEKLMECYEADPPHHFCHSMMYLPYLLDNLVQSEQFTSIPIAKFIERIWDSIIDWHCPREKEEGTQSSPSNQCNCYQKHDQILGQLVGTMARIDQNHARKMLTILPSSPSKVYAVECIATAGQVDEVLVEESKETILTTFQKPLQRAQAY